MDKLTINEILPEKLPDKRIKSKIIIGICVLSCLMLGIFLLINKNKDKPTLDSRYLELTVVEDHGRAVPGAIVYINSNFEGIIDSFGELRKSFYLLSNSTLEINIQKENLKTEKKLNVSDYKKDIRTSISI